MVKKNGQLKIQQMIFMLIAVTLFFVLVGLFMLKFKISEIKSSASELEEKNALLLVTKLANSPELSCGRVFGNNKVNCIDADKAMALKSISNKYSKFWGVSNIEIKKIYPAEREKFCELGNYPNCNLIKIFSKSIQGYSVANFVSLCRKSTFEGEIYDKCEVAKLIVSFEEKK